MIYGAYGLVEVCGAANGVIVLDQMLKTSEVEYEVEDTKCGGHALIFISGEVAAVSAAIERVTNNPPCKIIASAVVSNPSQEMIEIVEEFKKRKKK